MSILKRVALVITFLVLALIGVAAWMLRSRAEEIPAELPPTDVDPMSIVIPGGSGMPDLKLAEHKGKTVYLILGDRESMEARESKDFDRALNRWTYPPDVVGFAIGDAEGFKLLAGKIEEMLGAMRPEMRLPLYIDFDGAITKAFKLPKGHTGIVVLGPDGALKLRHSGPPKPKDQILTPEDDIIARLKLALRAEEPVLPPAPAFKVGALDNAACAGKTCLFVFLAAPIKKSQLPGVEGGFDGSMEDSMKQMQDPSIRLAGLALDLDEKLEKPEKDKDKALADKVISTLVGTTDLDLKHWTTLPTAPEGRTAFDIPEGQAALVAIDPEGHLALRELGVVPMYKLGRISELLDIDLGDRAE